jgi:hypothetical protein
MGKKYSINWENEVVVSVEVDGVQYASPDQIPDPEDRARVMLLMSGEPDMDFSLAASEPSALSKYIFLVFLAVAVLMLTISAITAVSTGRNLSREKSAPGVVVDLVTRKDSAGQEFSYPVVEFTLPNGSQKTVQLSEGYWPPAYEKGEPVTVLYDPQRPLTARIKSSSGTISRWTWSIITGVLGVAFAAATLFARWMINFKPGATELRTSE